MIYNVVFISNVLKLMAERRIAKSTLARKSGISVSLISDLTKGRCTNPTLETMENIANALDVPLSYLLEKTDADEQTLQVLSAGKEKPISDLPPGYERVTAVLSSFEAFVVRTKEKETRERMNKEAREKLRQEQQAKREKLRLQRTKKPSK